MSLPSFLQHVQSENSSCIFEHKPFGSCQCLWWPCSNPRTVILFIPGNPGLAKFYIPFLSAIYERSKDLCILAQSLLGHTDEAPAHFTDLFAQVAVAIQAFDALSQAYPNAKMVVIGHSVGSWISTQVLKARPVDMLLLLCPTIAHIVDTPNGRSISWLFRPPFPYLISKLSLLLRLVPSFILPALYRDWPNAQLQVLRELLRSPSCIQSCLSMAHEEMKTITEPDLDLLSTHKHRIYMYFVEKDGWVGKNKDLILQNFNADSGSVKVVHGTPGVPHAFCINHSQELADQCIRWMEEQS